MGRACEIRSVALIDGALDRGDELAGIREIALGDVSQHILRALCVECPQRIERCMVEQVLSVPRTAAVSESVCVGERSAAQRASATERRAAPPD